MRWLTPTTPAGLMVASVGRLPPEAAAAVAANGGRLVGAVEWHAVDELAACMSSPLVIAVVPGDIGHGPLERLQAIRDDAALDAVVAFDALSLDAVAAVLMGPSVTLLCDPGPSDWVTALALAAHRKNNVPAGVREGGGGDEGERLRRMNEEVARIAALLSSLVEERAEDRPTLGDRRQSYGAEPPADVSIDPADIRRTIRARRLRAEHVDARLVEDPGWDMLLDLLAAELERAQVSVSSLCIAAAVAPTTALRWITRMVAAGLFVRVPDADDRRRAFLVLSAPASAAMRGYVGAVRRAGLPVV